ncbi:putative SLC26A/SulP transporter [Helianthus annuus]|nr:putative SLC26A/SulP transporter [Helianthus annuus]
MKQLQLLKGHWSHSSCTRVFQVILTLTKTVVLIRILYSFSGYSFYRLGFLIDFLSHAAIVGFMGGVVVTIAVQQLKGLLGSKDFKIKIS